MVTAATALEDQRGRHQIGSLPILVVHAHSSCNCRCIMCDIWKNRDTKVFGVRELEPQLDSIRRLGVRWIVFSGGEPLMNAELFQVCSILRAEGIRLTLLSTGLLLKKHAAAVASSFEDVIVSLDGPRLIHDKIRRVDGAFDLLYAGVIAVRIERPSMQITARTTVQKANHAHLVEIAEAAKQLSLNGISYLAVDIASPAFNRPLFLPINRQDELSLTLSELTVLEKEIRTLTEIAQEEFAPGFIVESPEKLYRIVRHFRAHLGLEPSVAPICNAPWVSAVIEADGAVRPCFFHPTIGNLKETTLENVVNGKKGRTFRQELDIPNNSVCRNCVCSLNYRA
jgi:Fe-coproporphyrin III synthase